MADFTVVVCILCCPRTILCTIDAVPFVLINLQLERSAACVLHQRHAIYPRRVAASPRAIIAGTSARPGPTRSFTLACCPASHRALPRN
ncbi:hypothetical protein PF004_g32359, partial [Phytophthora fragariae]